MADSVFKKKILARKAKIDQKQFKEYMWSERLRIAMGLTEEDMLLARKVLIRIKIDIEREGMLTRGFVIRTAVPREDGTVPLEVVNLNEMLIKDKKLQDRLIKEIESKAYDQTWKDPLDSQDTEQDSQ